VTAFAKLPTLTPRKALFRLIFGVLALSVWASASNLSTFNVPGAGKSAGQGSQPIGINASGTVAGNYKDSKSVFHGFVRESSGAFTTINVPGAGTSAGQGTVLYGINDSGATTGYYIDEKNGYHGIVRASDGTLMTFEFPGAKAQFPLNINSAGAVAGYYLDAYNLFHGFLRAADGALTTFDVPSAGAGSGQGTTTGGFDCLNTAGAIAGNYTDSTGVFHGYVRAPDGAITTFEAPGAGTASGQGTEVAGINDANTIVGVYIDPNGADHGYVRDADGAITTFDVPRAGTGGGQGTVPQNINASGVIVGQYIDARGVNHHFQRTASGTITMADVSGERPGASVVKPGSGQGTLPLSNNEAGAVTGYYIDANNVHHGFVLTP
jgi:hypothetical protein